MLSSKLPLIIWFILVVTMYPICIVLFRSNNEHRRLKWFRQYKLIEWFVSGTLLISLFLFLIDPKVLSYDEAFEILIYFLLLPLVTFTAIFLLISTNDKARRIARVVALRNESISLRIAQKENQTLLLRVANRLFSFVVPALAIGLFSFTSARVFMFSLAPNTFEERCALVSHWRPVRGGLAVLTDQYIFDEKEFVVGRSQSPKDLTIGRQICVKSKKGVFGYRQITEYRFP